MAPFPTRNLMIFTRIVFDDLRCFKYVFYTFKMLGLATISVSMNKSGVNDRHGNYSIEFKDSLMGTIYNAALAIIKVVLGIVGFARTLHTESMINKVAHAIQTLLGTVATVLILLHFGFMQKSIAPIANRIVVIQRDLAFLNEKHNSRPVLYYILFFMIVYGIFFVAITIRGIFGQSDVIIFIAIILSSIINQFLSLQYTFVVRFLLRFLQGLNDTTHEFFVLSNNRNCSLITIGKLRLIRDLYLSIFDVSNDVSTFYSIIILSFIIHIFFDLTMTVYYLISPMIVNISIVDTAVTLDCLNWAIALSIPVFTLTMNVTLLCKEFKRTQQILRHSIKIPLKEDVMTEVEEFLEHLSHIKVKFTACGMVLLDNSLLLSILGSLTTYIVILIQFGSKPTQTNLNSSSTALNETIPLGQPKENY